ncbi:hypothetical protein ACFX2C_006297 [Malus domestica]
MKNQIPNFHPNFSEKQAEYSLSRKAKKPKKKSIAAASAVGMVASLLDFNASPSLSSQSFEPPFPRPTAKSIAYGFFLSVNGKPSVSR